MLHYCLKLLKSTLDTVLFVHASIKSMQSTNSNAFKQHKSGEVCVRAQQTLALRSERTCWGSTVFICIWDCVYPQKNVENELALVGRMSP